MNILLAAVNAKYIHSNLAVYSLRAFCGAAGLQVDLAEFTINQKSDEILEQIYFRKPELLVFSCYIWNIDMVTALAEEFHKICPQVPIWAGGPEVSFETERFLKENPAFAGVMMGEGERTFLRLCQLYTDMGGEVRNMEEQLSSLSGISFRKQDGTIAVQPLRELLAMDEIPFCYESTEDFQHRIIYYESSRGCPFQCSYCLSSVDKSLRFRSLSLVFRELQFFLDHRVPQVKFVDRTFNCNRDHALAVWRYITEHDNGVTNFHFEVSADLLDEEALNLIAGMRRGLIQLEIGVQTTHEPTLCEIRRRMDLSRVREAVRQVKQGENIHQHLDLIAGLPFEDYETFRHSFDEVYNWKPDQLQLGFLKVLKGSYLYDHAAEYGIVSCSKPPYEVLFTRWISYDQLRELHLAEAMLEQLYNSGLFRTVLSVLEMCYDSPFQMFLEIGRFCGKEGWMTGSHSRIQWTDMLLKFAVSVDPKRTELYKETLLFDLYRIEKSKKRPEWAVDLKQYRRGFSDYLRENGMEKKYCHIEPFRFLRLKEEGITVLSGQDLQYEMCGEMVWILFDYEKRDILTNEAALRQIPPK